MRQMHPQQRRTSLALLPLLALAVSGCGDDPVDPAPRVGTEAPSFAKGSSVADNSRFPVTFTIPGGTCGLSSTVTGTGVFHAVNRAAQTRSGEWRVSFSWSAHGTATGADGSTYRFNYAANGKWIDAVGPTTLPVEIELVDHFNLLGQGGTTDLRVVLHGRFLFDGVAITPIGDPVIRGAELACDPI